MRARSCASAKASFTMRWQSSNVPRTENERTLPPQQVSCRSWVGETSPLGNSTDTPTPGRLWNAAATAPPVSPDVATRICSCGSFGPRARPMQAARKRAPKSLNAAVGPWNSSSTLSRSSPVSGTRGAGKLKASFVMSGSFGSRRSPATNGAMKRAPMRGRSAASPNASTAARGHSAGR